MPCTGAKRLVQGPTLEGASMEGFFYTYVLQSKSDNKFYIGFTNDLERRVRQHQSGQNVSTKRRLPVELLYYEGHKSKQDAMRREAYFKTTKGKTTLKQMLRESIAL